MAIMQFSNKAHHFLVIVLKR